MEANESSEKEEAEHIEPSSSVEETVLNWEGDVEAIPNQKKSKKLKVTRLSDQTETINDVIIKCEKPLEQELSENPKKAKKRKRKVNFSFDVCKLNMPARLALAKLQTKLKILAYVTFYYFD